MNREDLDQLLEQSPFAWWDWDVSSNTVVFNDLKATMLGYAPEAFAGKGYAAFTSLIHPEDYEPAMEAMRRVLRNEVSLYQIDYRIQDRDGQYHWFMDRGFVMDTMPDGSPAKISGIVIDLGLESRFAGSMESVIDIVRYSLTPERSSEKSMLTVCSNCRRVKQSDQSYTPISDELLKLLGQKISHGICPDCVRSLYPEFAERILAQS